MLANLPKLQAHLRQSFALWRKILALLKYSDRRIGIIVLCVTLVEIILTLGAFYIIKVVLETISRTGSVAGNAANLFWLITLVMGLFLAGRIMQSIGNYYREAQGFIVSDYVNQAIQERAVAADLSFYDSSLYYDSLARARQAGANRPAVVIGNALNTLRGLLMLCGLIIFTATIEWRLLPVIMIAFALVLIVQIRFTRERFERQKQLVQNERRAGYADWLMTNGAFAKEIRLWDLGGHLRETYMNVRVAMRKDYLAIEVRKTLAEIFAATIGSLLFIAAGGSFLYQVSQGQSSILQLVLVIMLLQRAELAGRGLVSSLSQLYSDQMFIDQLFVFLGLKATIAQEGQKLAIPASNGEGIRLENVTFRYPNSPQAALQNVNMHIQPGKFTALVGGNGSGKTTLIKLLCRLYDPQEGRVTYNGVDVRDLDPVAYRRELSVIFQDFVQFAYSGRDNIRLAELSTPQDDARLRKTAHMSGAAEVLENLPKGYDTILARMFDDGVELSGGQWQKVALARTFYPTSKFIILDEPTSAIDPNAEAALFEDFREKMDSRGTLVISHRLSTIRQADYTYVLQNGRIAEEGTPDKLIASEGQYSEMFTRQGRGYKGLHN